MLNKTEKKIKILTRAAAAICTFLLFFLIYRHLVASAITSNYLYTIKLQRVASMMSSSIYGWMLAAYSKIIGTINLESGPLLIVSKITIGAATFMVVIYTMANMAKEALKGDVTIDYWLRILASMGVALLLVSNSTELMRGLFGLGQIITERVQETAYNVEMSSSGSSMGSFGTGRTEQDFIADLNTLFSDEEVELTEVQDEQTVKLIQLLQYAPAPLNETYNWYYPDEEDTENDDSSPQIVDSANVDMYELDSNYEVLGLVYIVNFLPFIVSVFLMFAALFEIYLRWILAPLAMANIAYDGTHSGGMRFIKKSFGVYLKIGIYFAMAFVGWMVEVQFLKQLDPATIHSTGELLINWGMVLLSNVVCAFMMMQSGGIADEIVGV